jgi:hypothetical protein
MDITFLLEWITDVALELTLGLGAKKSRIAMVDFVGGLIEILVDW